MKESLSSLWRISWTSWELIKGSAGPQALMRRVAVFCYWCACSETSNGKHRGTEVWDKINACHIEKKKDKIMNGGLCEVLDFDILLDSQRLLRKAEEEEEEEEEEEKEEEEEEAKERKKKTKKK